MFDENTAIEDVDFIAFDLETTGLSPIGGAIVELGALRFRLDGTRAATFHQLIQPGMPIPRDATRIHGITDRMVRDEPAIESVLPRFIAFLTEVPGLLMAHNASFDLGFLNDAVARCSVTFSELAVIDTLDLARRCLPGCSSYRLEDLAIRLRIAETEEHRALADAELAAALFQKMVRRARSLRTVADLFSRTRPLSFRPEGAAVADVPERYEELLVAIRQQRSVLLVYDGGTRRAAERRVTPKRIVHSGGRMYLCAYCHWDKIEKNFRLDRICRYKVE